jgi:lambda repressor-like predicted transcriptional regulator
VTESEERGASETLLTLRQASRRTGLSATTLRRYIKSSRLDARLAPGRYGPEYVVSEAGLRAAGVSMREEAGSDHPAAEEAAPPAPARTAQHVAPHAASADAVPAMLYRELLMKHEQLLVQYGMLRVGGLRIYETRNETAREVEHARETIGELRAEEQRLRAENEELETRIRQLELEVAAANDELREEQRTVKRLEIELRNAATVKRIDTEYSSAIERPHPLTPPRPAAPPAERDH